MNKLLDKSGREIKAMDLIVYGHALGRCAALQYGKVLAIKYTDDGEIQCIIRGVETSDWNPPRLLKKSTLLYGDRIIILSREQLPADVLQILDGVEA